MKILILDNYDSFTYNLFHYAEKINNGNVDVFRNDKIGIEEALEYDKIILSPGPGLPSEAGILMDLVKNASGKVPILGVCLGHQAIGEAFGGRLINLEHVFHGVASRITVTSDDILFRNLPPEFNVGRYHSWVVEKESLPSCFEITSTDEQGLIMSMHHKTLDIRSVQFHPESVMTEYGELMLRNWIEA